jgi:polar amino acid transport system ATP-binding protein
VSDALVEISGLRKSFGLTKVLNGVDLEVRRGEVVTIIGPSGSGKTTLLRCVNALETYDSGSIRLDGTEVGYAGEGGARRPRRDRELARLRAEAGMVFQLFYLFPHLTAAENVMLGLRRVRRLPKAEAQARALHWLERVGLADRAGHLPSQLSGGQQQRVGIARAVAMQPKLLLLDEITSSLDPELVGEVLAVVRRLADEGMTMLVVTHEMGFAREVSEQVVFMEAGLVVEAGPPVDVMQNPASERLRAFLSRFL